MIRILLVISFLSALMVSNFAFTMEQEREAFATSKQQAKYNCSNVLSAAYAYLPSADTVKKVGVCVLVVSIIVTPFLAIPFALAFTEGGQVAAERIGTSDTTYLQGNPVCSIEDSKPLTCEQASECTLTAYQYLGVGHASASLSCQDNSVTTLNVGLYPTDFGVSFDVSAFSHVRNVVHLAGSLQLLSLMQNRESSYIYNVARLAALSSNLALKSGMILDETERMSGREISQKVELKISKEQALRLQAYIHAARMDCNSWIQRECRYAVIGRNCVDFVQELFELAGSTQHFILYGQRQSKHTKQSLWVYSFSFRLGGQIFVKTALTNALGNLLLFSSFY